MSDSIDAAYEYCREITHRESSSFYYGFLLLLHLDAFLRLGRGHS